MELRGDRVVLRPLAEADVPRIVELGADPEVARWWRGLTRERVLEKARGEDDCAVVFVITSGGGVAGMIQVGFGASASCGSTGSTPKACGATASSSTCWPGS